MSKTKQIAVRTYPFGYYGRCDELDRYLELGYKVVLSNPIIDDKGAQGVEYILEKEIES